MQINISHATLKYTHRFRHPLEVPDKICLQPNSAEQTMDMQGHEVSVVVPLLNEQDNVKPLYKQITQVLTNKYDYEIIFIDDGSSDNSFSILARLHKNDSRLRIITLRKNFGQTAALSAGFTHARTRQNHRRN